jgi:hypothetical protein
MRAISRAVSPLSIRAGTWRSTAGVIFHGLDIWRIPFTSVQSKWALPIRNVCDIGPKNCSRAPLFELVPSRLYTMAKPITKRGEGFLRNDPRQDAIGTSTTHPLDRTRTHQVQGFLAQVIDAVSRRF